MIEKSHRLQKTAIAAAAAALLSLSATPALALSLGRLSIQSALGEPLRAEIDVPDINEEEKSSLKTTVAKPAAFVAAGLDFNPALIGLQMSLEQRPDGRHFIRLRSDRPINDPFIDLILEATWSSGRILRDYTMLLDPPSLRPAPPAPALAQVSPSVVPPAAPATAPAASAPASSSAPKTPPAEPATTKGKLKVKPKAEEPAEKPAAAPAKPVAKEKPAAPAPVAAPTPLAADPDAKQVKVKAGDTASKIVSRAKTEGVSLDQMLVALLRTNPEAFIAGNINRIRTGSVVNLPTAEQAQTVPAPEATKIIHAQSGDFNAFRRNLASNAPTTTVDSANRNAGGTVGAKVEEKKPTAASPDKLTLSKGSVAAGKESAIAKDRAAEDAKARAAELAKNIADLKKLQAQTGAAPAPSAPAAAPAPATPPAPPAPAVAPAVPATPVAAPSTAPTDGTATVTPVPAPAVAAVEKPLPKPAKPVAPPPPAEEPSLLDQLLDNPIIPAAGGLLALLGGWLVYRRRAKRGDDAASSFLESKLQLDSLFGKKSSQIDTSNASAPISSLVYGGSQMDAADDVDPVAEADVYLAYGRDQQAEEILREAIRVTPDRLAIHTKLLEIYAKRRDAKAFEYAARQAYGLTTGLNDPDWQQICQMGLGIDPVNALYQPGGTPDAVAPSGNAYEATQAFTSTMAQASDIAPAAGGAVDVDLDLDLDFSIAAPAAEPEPTPVPAAPVAAPEPEPAPAADNSLDFDISPPAAPAASAEESSTANEPTMTLDAMAFDEPMPSLELPAAAAEPETPQSTDMLEFDLGSISLDLTPPDAAAAPAAPTAAPEQDDPLATKLALAEEFVSIGDEDGARALLEEVIAEASSETVREQAQQALGRLR